MSRKKDMQQEEYKVRTRRPRVGYVMVSPDGMPVPAPTPSNNLQVSPIIQPMVLMVNTTQAPQSPYNGYQEEDY